jgi:hypothetical protein
MFGRNGHEIMPNRSDSMADSGEPVNYQIRLKGHLDRRWTDWFEGLTIMHEEGGETLLTGPVVDQAALHGLLRRVRDLGIPLISVVRSEKGGHTGQDRER